jgi:hypothetical protein
MRCGKLSDYSITSSAIASGLSGISRPSVLAVLIYHEFIVASVLAPEDQSVSPIENATDGPLDFEPIIQINRAHALNNDRHH